MSIASERNEAQDRKDSNDHPEPLIDLAGIEVEDIDIGEFLEGGGPDGSEVSLEYLAASCTTCICTCSCCSSS